MSERRLRVAVLLDNPQPAAPWILRLLSRICAEPEFELCALIQSVHSVPSSRGSALVRFWLGLERKFAARPLRAQSPAYASLAEGLVELKSDEEARLESLDLDVVLDLTGDLSHCPPARTARHGIWFLDFTTAGDGAAALKAIIGSEPVTRISLFRRDAKVTEPVAISSATLNTKFVAARNALFMCEKAVTLIIRELKHAHVTGRTRELAGADFKAASEPGMSDFFGYLKKLVAAAFARLVEAGEAKLGLRPGMFFLKTASGDVLEFDPAAARAQIPKGNQYYADPFLWLHEGECHCFFEVYDYSTGKGHISVGRFEDGALVDVKQALSTEYHLSFPFLFEDGGHLYMMPETCGARRLEIWRCTDFPDKWERHATALEGILAADSTMAKIDGTWWLFTNVSRDPFGEMNSELHLYQVDGPDLKKLVPHPLNPVVFDSRTARNGGRILEIDGTYYRPSQDNSHGRYGHGVNLMRIDRITPNEYSEVLVRRIEPDFEEGIVGCHHLDTRAGFVVMEVCKRLGGP